ncbi:MAG: hypothetical protein R2864_07015 [Syntrophotaleaceae bacterium]
MKIKKKPIAGFGHHVVPLVVIAPSTFWIPLLAPGWWKMNWVESKEVFTHKKP